MTTSKKLSRFHVLKRRQLSLLNAYVGTTVFYSRWCIEQFARAMHSNFSCSELWAINLTGWTENALEVTPPNAGIGAVTCNFSYPLSARRMDQLHAHCQQPNCVRC